MPTTTKKTRSRWTRTPHTEEITLSARHVAILELHRTRRFIRSSNIYDLLPDHIRGKYRKNTKLRDALEELFHGYQAGEGQHHYWLERPRQQKDAYNARYAPVITGIADEGERLLAKRDRDGALPPPNQRRGRHGENRQFPHSMMICDTEQAMEIGARRATHIRFISTEEIIENAPDATRKSLNPYAIRAHVEWTFTRRKQTDRGRVIETEEDEEHDFDLVPDGLFGLEFAFSDGTKAARYYALEAENKNNVWETTLKENSWLRKVLAYRFLIREELYKERWGIPNLRVLAVCGERRHLDRMKECLLKVSEGKGSTRFAFMHIPVLGYEDEPSVAFDQIFAVGWERVGFLPYRLDEWEQAAARAAE